MTNLKSLLDLADELDQLNLEKQADAISEYIFKTAKVGMHKCGLKEETVNNHETLLEGYQKAQEHFRKEYKKSMQSRNETESPNMGKLREISESCTHNANAVFLHNMYFDDVINSKPFSLDKDNQMKDLLKELYDGGAPKFTDEIKRISKIPRNGWVLLNFCTLEKKLFLNVIDLHDQHVSACSVPVLALDMWEHAYINDFGLDKEAYVDWFLERIDWRNVRNRVKNLMRIR